MLHSINGSVNGRGPLRGALPRRRGWMLTVAGLCLTFLMISAALGHAEGHTSRKYWKGKNIADASKKYGDPIQTTPLTETGGNLYIYHHEHHYWVFTTDAGGKIIKAVKVH